MRAIYQPAGRALEYAPLACNLYDGCTHGCSYCYVPACLHRPRESFHLGCTLRPGVLDQLRVDCAGMVQKGVGLEREILFSFTGDPYCLGADTSGTREALRIVGEAGLRATVLTKAGRAAARDFDLLRRYGFSLGQSLVWHDDDKRMRWEPNASASFERMATMAEAKAFGIRTWVSMEPVIEPRECWKVVRAFGWHQPDLWKVGRVNYSRIEDEREYVRGLVEVLDAIGEFGGRVYVKADTVVLLKKHKA